MAENARGPRNMRKHRLISIIYARAITGQNLCCTSAPASAAASRSVGSAAYSATTDSGVGSLSWNEPKDET